MTIAVYIFDSKKCVLDVHWFLYTHTLDEQQLQLELAWLYGEYGNTAQIVISN